MTLRSRAMRSRNSKIVSPGFGTLRVFERKLTDRAPYLVARTRRCQHLPGDVKKRAFVF